MGAIAKVKACKSTGNLSTCWFLLGLIEKYEGLKSFVVQAVQKKLTCA